jgi:Mg2+/Co2+ transporter CorC
MKKKILVALAFMGIAFLSRAQNLQSFTAALQTKENSSYYLSVLTKKVYTEAEAKNNKSVIDVALLITKSSGKQKMEWYNMSGKDSIIPKEIRGTATVINAISFDREQFDKCKTNQDLKRMTGHLTNSSFSHFASISDDVSKGITYHCFIIQLENGKRALLWLEDIVNNTIKVIVKVQV